MYDGNSLCKLLLLVGFHNPQEMAPGTTIISETHGLDLKERLPESVYIEATNL